MMAKVKLYTAAGEFVAEVYTLPYQFWPQAFWWGQRMFARENFRDVSCPCPGEPPAYYECTPLFAYDRELAERMGWLGIAGEPTQSTNQI